MKCTKNFNEEVRISNTPKYAETIIVLVKYKASNRWFVTDKELWFLDLRKLAKAFKEKGYEIHSPDDFSDRFDMAVVNEDNAEGFLDKISDYEAETEELVRILKEGLYGHITDMFPSLYVDFDGKELISYYPEPASYEYYVPDGWAGKYEPFLENIPEDCRYWISHGGDGFKED
ncbi:hypothetical protein ACTID9_22940 [Brevibacillus fluminis]|uniref:hypothetical protein n=1 Tax=Brevibacillus fluminis TaxID=511487 RepID=UPI003F8AE17A